MAYGFLDIATTPSVERARHRNGSEDYWTNFKGDRAFDRLTENEAAFVARRDSFYMATVSESGWPYVQHRGGPAGFLKVIDERTLACADFRGNRQYLSVGNLAADDRASLILVDYPVRRRLKIFAHSSITEDREMLQRTALPEYRGVVERALVFRLEAFDWNCPQHITPRFTEAEIERAVSPLRDRLAALESENARLRATVDAGGR